MADEVQFVGRSREATNHVFTRPLHFAGNPLSTYGQDEGCVAYGLPMQASARRTPLQRLGTRVTVWSIRALLSWTPWRPNWLQLRFVERSRSAWLPAGAMGASDSQRSLQHAAYSPT